MLKKPILHQPTPGAPPGVLAAFSYHGKHSVVISWLLDWAPICLGAAGFRQCLFPPFLSFFLIFGTVAFSGDEAPVCGRYGATSRARYTVLYEYDTVPVLSRTADVGL